MSILLSICASLAFAQPSTPAGTNYVLSWSDEFNQAAGSGPNPANWVFDLGSGGWGNNELQTYVNDLAHCQVVTDPEATDGLALRIQATKEGTVYKSARIKTLGKVQPMYGWIEARLKLPSGQGIWPAFWAMGTNGARWPGNGEIDIMENGGNSSWLNRNQSALHGTGYSGGSAVTASYTLQSGAFRDAYHLFQMQWSPFTIKFYVDGNLYGTKTALDIGSNPWLFNQPFYFLANCAIGGNFAGNPDATTVFPQNYMLDYVRVYSAHNSALASVPSVSAAAASSQVNLNLSSTGAEYFNIYRSTTSNGQGATPYFTNAKGLTWSDTTAKNGTKYYYKVTALNYAGETARSAEVSATPAAGIPTVKTDFLQNFLTVSSKTAGWAIDISNPTYFDGDTARANRTSDSTQSITYSYPNISGFSAKVYAWQAPISKVTFSYNISGNTYISIPVNYGTKSSASGWGYYTITPSGALPAGVKSLKVTFTSGTGNGWDPQLSQITINHS
jgi:beta-glucanase (GH16 family)